jgi:Domain of unknown function (DUF4432)
MQNASAVPLQQVANLDQIARATASRVDGGPGDGMRVIDVAMLGGLSMRVLPDRGLDIGATWCGTPGGGQAPISWTSKVGEVQPLDEPTGTAWIRRFSGGLLTTCGLDNVGPASDGVGMHGTYSHLRAGNVQIDRTVHDGTVTVAITGTVDDVQALSRHIRVHRTITTVTGRSWVRIEDMIENLGPEIEPIPVLYHCNFGFPFWSDGSTVSYPNGTVAVPRDADAAANMDTTHFPGTGHGWPERVYEHRLPSPSSGATQATIVSPLTGLTAELSWSTQTLDRCVQWIHPGAGISALGVEPTNSCVSGRAAARDEGRLPLLAPGDRQSMWVEIAVCPTATVCPTADSTWVATS